MKSLAIDPKVWTDLTVVEAVPHGTRVKKDDLLLKLDPEKITEQIEDLDQAEPAAKIALELATAELENLEQTTPNRLEAAQRTRRRANEDYAYFEKTDRVQREKNIEFNLKSSEQRLRYAAEELMYDADDITEETEEIILERQKFAVESATFYLESAKLNHAREMKTTLPREHENLKAAKIDQDQALILAEASLPKTLANKRFALEKQKRDQKKSTKKLADLKEDLKLLTFRAPADGIIYYGACEQGKWTTAPVVAKKMVLGGKVAPKEIFMTLVSPDRLVLRAVVPEDKLAQLKPDLEGSAAPVSAPDKKLKAKLEEIDYVPLPTGGFGAVFSLSKDTQTRLMPGMTCKLTFEDTEKKPLQVPKGAVFGEGDSRHVFKMKEDGSNEKLTVKVGELAGNNLEILSGIAEGDRLLLQKPN
jgi:multidrug efflux pump subunit AcrA (membrane-fusion protein)